jgi:hypothetical protein
MAETASVRELTENSPVQMAQVIAGLLAGRTARDVAADVGVPTARVSRWYRESDDFRRMLEETSRAVTDQVRAITVSEIADQTVDLLPKAKEVLEAMLDSEKDSTRLAAANSVYRYAGFGARAQAPATAPVRRLIGAMGGSPADGD